MDSKRRRLIQSGTALASLITLGIFSPSAVQASENQDAFDTTSFEQALKALGTNIVENDQIELLVTDLAEDGSLVPLSVSSRLPNTQAIYILIENNPYPLTAAFMIPEGTDASVDIRVKMADSSPIHALVEADGKFYSTKSTVKVRVGGCA